MCTLVSGESLSELPLHISISVLADMDASDTALVQIQGSGGADQLDLSQSAFSGFLAC